jgi:predicted dehydrogenase
MPIDPTRRDFIRASGSGLLAAAAAIPLAPPDKQRPQLPVPKPGGKKIGWAIVGLGQLALAEVMPAFREAKLSKPVALVSGHPDKAKAVAEAYEIDPKNIYNYENFDSIKDNDAVDVVYIILPNSMHAEYTIRSAKAAKHVLCEKPMCANVAEAQQMIDACKAAGKKLMVAYRLHFEPYNQAAIQFCREKLCGPIVQMEMSNMQNTKPPNIRLSKALAGGPLGDIGVYCINACRYLSGEEPVEVTAMSYQPTDDPRFAEVPRDYVFTMRFPSGVHAHCGVTFGSNSSRRYRVHCTDGYIDMERPFGYSGQELKTFKQRQETKHTLETVNHFAAEMDHLSECVMNNKDPLTPGEEGLADMKVIAAIEQAARTGQKTRVS